MRAEVVVQIARAPEEVFAYLTDISNLPSWQSGVNSVSLEGELSTGKRYRESRHIFGRNLQTTIEVEEYVPPRLFALRALDSPVPFRVRHELQASDGGTRVTVTGEADAGNVPGFAARIMAKRARKQFQKDFERLKRLLES